MMKYLLKATAVLATMALALPTFAASDTPTLYVSPIGSGQICSKSKPCKEIKFAINKATQNTTIEISPGTYKGFDIKYFQGPLNLKAKGNVIIKPTSDRPDNRDNIFISKSSQITLDGLNTNNAKRSGVRVSESQDVTIKNGRFAGSQTWGIFADFADNLTLENNEAMGSRQEHGIYVSNSSKNPKIINNKVHDNAAAGIQLNADRNMGGDGIISGAQIRGNTIYNNGRKGAAAINLDGVIDSSIVNNNLYNNKATGIVAFKSDGALGPKNLIIGDNKISMPKNSRYAIQVFNSTGHFEITNNLIENQGKNGSLKFLDQNDLNNLLSDFNVFKGNKNISLEDDRKILNINQWKSLGFDSNSTVSK